MATGHRLRSYLLGLFLLLPVGLSSASAEEVPVTIDVWSIPGVGAAADASGTATLSDALAGRLDFRPGTSITVWGPASPLRPLHIWIRVPVPAGMQSGTGPWYLTGSRYLGRATVYAKRADTRAWSSNALGIRIPFAQRSVERALPTARLPDRLRAGAAIYIDAAADLYFLPLYLQNGAALTAEDQETGKKQRIVLLLCGIFLTLGLCNLLVFASTREFPYLLYSLSMIILAAIGPMQSSALAWEIFWPHASLPDAATRYVALFFESYVSLLFAYTFLRTRQYAPILSRLVVTFLIVAPVADFIDVLLFPSFPLGWGLTLADLQVAFTTTMWFLIVVLALAAARAGVRSARLVALAFGVVFVCSFVYAASTYFWNDASRAWTYLLLLGSRVFEGFVLFWALADRLQRTMAEALATTQQLLLETKRATTDPLTGIANRRVFDEALLSEFKRARRDGTTLTVVMFDIDHFKKYNDTFGHVAGDRCIVVVASEIAQSAKRPNDIAARYGGEEFAMILPGTDAAAAKAIANDVRANIQARNIVHSGSSGGFVTISAGVATLTESETDGEMLLRAADTALYAAKASGRDRVVVRSAVLAIDLAN